MCLPFEINGTLKELGLTYGKSKIGSPFHSIPVHKKCVKNLISKANFKLLKQTLANLFLTLGWEVS